MRKNSVPIEEPTINLTPLIDVVFVILIMFIVVTPLLEVDKISLADGASETSTSAAKESQGLSIHVKKDNSISLNKKLIDKEQLTTACKQIHQEKPDITPQLFQDKEASFGTYQTVKNAVEAAGFTHLDIVLKPV